MFGCRYTRRSKLVAFVIPGIFLFPPFSSAANHYVRAGATGTNSGSDWTNACTDIGKGGCATLTRGDTYFIAGGSYGVLNLSTPESGTLTITIQRATVNNHGTDTGWSATYDGVVHWTYSVNINTNYWVFDGVTGSGKGPAGYGFVEDQPSSCSQDQHYFFVNQNNTTVSHLAIVSCGRSFNGFEQQGFQVTRNPTSNNNTASYIYLSGFQNAVLLVGAQNLTMDHFYVENNWSAPTHHGGAFDIFDTNNPSGTITLRYSIVDGCQGTACLDCNQAGSESVQAINHWFIYGNLFTNNSTGPDGGVGNGTIAGTSNCVIANTSVYNNTFGNDGGGSWFWQANPGDPVANQAVNNVLYDNLIWNGVCTPAQNGGGVITQDYNTYFSCVDTPPVEAHGQTGSLNPFLNTSAGNYHLSVPTLDALHLSAPFNVDMDGQVRSGVWSRGTYQYITGNQPAPPTSLALVVQ